MPAMHYTADNCMAELLRALPGFQAHWDDHLAACGNEPAGLLLDLVELAAYAHALLERHHQHAAELATLFGPAESMLDHGSAPVRAAVQGGFIEALLYPLADPLADPSAGPLTRPPAPAATGNARLLPVLAALLGPNGRAYARHWAAVVGAELPGF
jgi:hypothetical protein